MKCKIKSALKFIPMSQIMVLTLTALYSRWPGPHNFTREETGVSWNKLDMPTFIKCNGTREKRSRSHRLSFWILAPIWAQTWNSRSTIVAKRNVDLTFCWSCRLKQKPRTWNHHIKASLPCHQYYEKVSYCLLLECIYNLIKCLWVRFTISKMKMLDMHNRELGLSRSKEKKSFNTLISGVCIIKLHIRVINSGA
jgi:hypothetical protein